MNISRYVKIALFFIVLGGSGGAYIIMSSDGLNRFNMNVYEVTLPDATGISTRSKVFLAGVPVGKVQAVKLAGTEARLRVAFLKDIDIRGNAQISRRSSSILGTSILMLDPGTESFPPVPPGGSLDAAPNLTDMNAVMGQVQEMGGQIAAILSEFQKNQMALLTVSLETFNSIAGKVDARSEAELERVSRILESTALITERAERLFREREGEVGGSMTNIHGALENIRSITGEIRQGQGNLGQAVYDDRLYASLLATVEKTERAAEKLQTALDSINRLTQNVDGVVNNAGEIVERAAGLGIQVDTHARYDFMGERMLAGASLRLDPRSNDRWYRIGVSSAPQGVSIRTLTSTETNTGGGPPVTKVENVTETRYAFSVDAELARRFGILTLRGGILESSAGLGLDLQPIRWMSVSGELFNFTAEEAPNLRGTLTIFPFFDPHSDKPWNWIYLRGGINNALSGERDFFLGGGLRFSDREVKGLVGILPALGN